MTTDAAPERILGITVPAALVTAWTGWFCPPLQPFPVDGLPESLIAQLPARSVTPTPEARDTFFLYRGSWRWLDEQEFDGLPREAQRLLRRARRLATRPKPPVPWPSSLEDGNLGPLLTWIEAGCRPSRHDEVGPATWARCAQVLPQAQQLAGTFSTRGSGANCFGTVMAAAGVPETAESWVQADDFSAWLRGAAEPVRGRTGDDRPGTVLVWWVRGEAVHAALTLGDGWALSKPSQSWSSPRLVRSVRETILGWRLPGTRLSRHVLHRSAR